MVIDLDQFRAVRETAESALKTGTYDGHRTKSAALGAAIYAFRETEVGSATPGLPEDLSRIDVQGFLGRVYALAKQI